MKINIIIPMAGESSRFNYNFKPLLFLDNRRFIQHCMDSFLPYNDSIESYSFIITKQQEEDNDIINNIRNLFSHISNKINIIQIEKKTSGPYKTILKALEKIQNLNNLIICDSDHYVNIEPIIKKLNCKSFNNDILIPIWNINYNEQQNWGKIIFDKSNKNIIKICEKEIIEENNNINIYGMIGCYYFKSSNILDKNVDYDNISDFLKNNINKLNVDIIKINDAYFFGTPSMVDKTIKIRRKYETIFCDIDGVLLKHSPNSNDDIESNIILGNCIKKLKEWKQDKKKIILCTARPGNTKNTLKNLLKYYDIYYDDLIMDLNPGPRYIINDVKPSNIFVKQAIEINLIRDNGIDNIELNEDKNYDIDIIKVFKGNSFSKTFLLKEGNHKFVRKYIIKNNETYEHYQKLKRQCEDLKRFKYFDENLVPGILKENDTRFDYYFDLHFLENHEQLDTYNESIQNNVINIVVNKLINNVYCFKKNNNDDFMKKFFNDKIYPKLSAFENECPIMNYLINNENVKINNKEYFGLKSLFNKLSINDFSSKYIHPIHGDLTLENILYDINNNDIKLIDMEGSRYVDSSLFDLGKLFQSIVSNYKEWNSIEKVILNNKIDNLTCIDTYFHENHQGFLKYKPICETFNILLNNSNWIKTFQQGIFFMSTYFIRFVQFRRQISKEHGIFAIIMAINWFNFVYNLENGYYIEKFNYN